MAERPAAWASSSQTAMLLTQAEWEDLAAICEEYLGATIWEADEDLRLLYGANPDRLERVVRRRKLADKIIDAAEV